MFKTHWGSQNYCQMIFITDCGIGLGHTSLKNTVINLQSWKTRATTTGFKGPFSVKFWIGFSYPSKLTFMGLGSLADPAFKCGTKMYQKLLDVSGQNGQLFIPKLKNLSIEDPIGEDVEDNSKLLNRRCVKDMFDKMCEQNYKQFEATLRCGGYFRLDGAIIIWPAPLPYTSKDLFGAETTKIISRKLEICGYISLSDVGSPMSVSRHLILPRSEGDKRISSKDGNLSPEEKLEIDIKGFYAKPDSGGGVENDDDVAATGDATRESVCVLLHGALKVENMAALVLLNENWYGFIYSYADSKKKSNLMLNVLPPGNDVVPWLGDFRNLAYQDDALPGENPSFPIKAEKRSYSQNIVVWIRQPGLQSDIQKALRHAKKLPEKTQHFYKELNRIRRAALSLGFLELLDGLANIFEREAAALGPSASPDCTIQLKHAASELRKPTNRDMKAVIQAMPTKYNQIAS
ncbi:integrator complex subunit 14 isoform X2 [Toxorhynchites rutilus septentrionalis]|nr:integrator complex subunit 14 isoform X2 [Toxorhynchites rutilus septentrionalis]XP_055622361.1 integrator complex subunit 14 isoform X2 [Toxorhynchites rutilus septentrionalis]XP_055622362.1 integrator complex subunit 14 isoform X2 [Toxorhynchites rutilus septentrionalis]XP_055622363.1 integrator complex subunit 14 isoform X2 [Toxorhynchites rutilus septentrionalis]